MNIFITGGSSYLGRFILNNFPNFNFFALKNNSEIKANSNVHMINKNEFLKSNNFFMDNKIDTIIHLASFTNRNNDKKYYQDIIETNVNLGKIIVEMSKKSNVKKFLNFGSYSQLVFTKPPNLYVKTKNIFQKHLEKNNKNFELGITNFYLGDLYGPNDSRDKLIPYLLMNEDNEIIKFESNGLGSFSPIHIDDVLEAIKKELELDNKINFKNIVLSTEVMTMKDFIKIFKKIRNKNFLESYNLSQINPYSDFQKLNKLAFNESIDLKIGLSSL